MYLVGLLTVGMSGNTQFLYVCMQPRMIMDLFRVFSVNISFEHFLAPGSRWAVIWNVCQLA